jgi:hypothetical protein
MKFSVDWTTHHQKNFEFALSCLPQDQALTVLEIGCYEGRTTKFFADRVLQDTQSHMHTVDPHVKPAFFENLHQEIETKKLTHHSQSSFEALLGFTNQNQKFDLIYLDGSHLAKNLLSDLALAFPLLKTNGLLLIDDYQWDHPTYLVNAFDLEKHGLKIENYFLWANYFRPYMAVEAFLNAHSLDIELLLKNYQVLVRKKEAFDKRTLKKDVRAFCP